MSYIGSKPANKAVVASDLDPAVITGQTALAVAPADTDEFLISDAGTLKRLDASLVGADGITEADTWYLTSDITVAASVTDITANLSRSGTSGITVLGSGMSVSSGIFTFPSTGYYLVQYTAQWDNAIGGVLWQQVRAYFTTDNSSYTQLNSPSSGHTGYFSQAFGSVIVDVTDTSNCKIKFATAAQQSSKGVLKGSSSQQETGFSFIKIANT